MTTNSNAVITLGRIVATANALDHVDMATIAEALYRHEHGDWGEVCEADRQENERAVLHGSRILSVYRSQGEERFWVITESDRSVTTVLMPQDY